MNWFLAIMVGVVAGAFAGALGIGGGIIMVPLMVWLFGFSQQKAQGTSLLTLTLPVSLAGAYQYYRRGEADVSHALLIACGFVLGAYTSAGWVSHLPPGFLKKGFGTLLLFVGGKMIVDGAFEKGTAPLPWLAGGIGAAALGAWSRWRKGPKAPVPPPKDSAPEE
jgi:uncharacterized membrane protein YfcA